MIKRPATSLSKNYRSQEKPVDPRGSQPKLPNLSDVINIRLKSYNEKELQEMIQNLVKQVQTLNTAVTQKDKQIQQYEFMIKSLQIAIEKRDFIISALRQEKTQTIECNPQQKLLPKSSEESSRLLNQPKKTVRARTKETNFDDNLQSILEADYQQLQQYMRMYDELNHINQIKLLVQNEDTFQQNIQKMEITGILNIFDSIILTLQEHKILFRNVIKVNKLFSSSLRLQEQIPIGDQLDQLSAQMRDSLECDIVQIFVLDNQTQELWCKSKDRTIRKTCNEDIIGSCFQEKHIINVHNAYNDPRFKKENDKSYKTNTILLAPILDKQLNSIGVINAINKMQGHFHNDDQQYLQKTSEIISILLRNHQQSNESISIQNALRNIINANASIMYLRSLEDILFEAESQLKNIFHTQKGLVYLVREGKLLRANERKQIETYVSQIGIIGEAHKTKEFLQTPNAYNHQSFNNLVDIQTTMPIYCYEISGQKISVIMQVINNKGIRSQKVSSFDQELMEMFGKVLLSKLESMNLEN